MNRRIVAQQGVDAAYGISDNVGHSRAAVEGSNPPKRTPSCAYKAPRRTPFSVMWTLVDRD
jgi:hypothetical protein